MFQRFNLFGHLTALQNVALAPRLVRGLTVAGLTGRVVADLWADREPDLDLACCAPDRFARAGDA